MTLCRSGETQHILTTSSNKGDDDHNCTLPLVAIKVNGIRAMSILDLAADNNIIYKQLFDKIDFNTPQKDGYTSPYYNWCRKEFGL